MILCRAAVRGATTSSCSGWIGIAQEQLSKREAAVAGIQSVAEAEARRQAVRAKILELIGGLPDYSGPLNARVTGQIEQTALRDRESDLREPAQSFHHGQRVPSQAAGPIIRAC